MPKVRRENLPRPLFRHLATRLCEREISTDQLELLLVWLETEPAVPKERWVQTISGSDGCGEGELIKTFLSSDQAARGEEIV